MGLGIGIVSDIICFLSGDLAKLGSCLERYMHQKLVMAPGEYSIVPAVWKSKGLP